MRWPILAVSWVGTSTTCLSTSRLTVRVESNTVPESVNVANSPSTSLLVSGFTSTSYLSACARFPERLRNLSLFAAQMLDKVN